MLASSLQTQDQRTHIQKLCSLFKVEAQIESQAGGRWHMPARYFAITETVSKGLNATLGKLFQYLSSLSLSLHPLIDVCAYF